MVRSKQSLLSRRKTTICADALRFKLHLAINHRGELLNIALTTGNIDDRKPVRELLKGQYGQFFGDKGYISAALAQDLRQSNIILVTKFKKRMKNKLMTMLDKQLLRKRAIVESVIDQLKNISQIEHSRHRSPTNFVVNLLAGLIASSPSSKKAIAARMCRSSQTTGNAMHSAL